MINRRHLFRFALLTAAALLTGCSAEILDGHGGQVPICLTASVQQDKGMTRAGTAIQSAQFEQGATFYAYFPNGARIGNAASACHTTFTTTNTSGATDPATQPYFNADASSADVYAYYPQTVTEAASQKFSVSLDQSGDVGYKASDLMYATTTVTVNKSSASSATGLLTFSHKMSKIIVSATAGAGITAIRQVRIVGGNRSITIVNPMTTDENTNPFFGPTPSLSDAITTADNGCVKLYNDATGEATVSCAGLIPPQTIDSSTAFLEVVTDVGTATYSLGSAKTFVPGESYAYSISLTLASIGITTAINDWTAAGDPTELWNNGTATLLVDPGVSLSSAEATVGMVIGANGKAYNTIADANTYTTAAAIIAYKGNGEDDSSYNNGLAISLKNVDGMKKWKSSNNGTCTAQGDFNTIKSDLGGLAHTATLCSDDHSSHGHEAAVAANGYTSTMAKPANCSTWFLPTIGQWKLIVEAMCGGTGLTTSGKDTYKAANFNKKIRTAYGVSESTTCEGDVRDSNYWSSVECSTGLAWGMTFFAGLALDRDKYNTYNVRPVLAF